MQTFTETLRAKPGSDGVRELRALLKRGLRSYGLRATDVREGINDATPRRREMKRRQTLARTDRRQVMSRTYDALSKQSEQQQQQKKQELMTTVASPPAAPE